MIIQEFLHEIVPMTVEVAIALAPMIVIFAAFQALFLKLHGRALLRMAIGMIYTWIGLVLFLVGVNVGFLPAGTELGRMLGALEHNWLLIPIGMVIGFTVVFAEPAVHVLNKQVEEVSGGQISGKVLLFSLGIAVSIAVGIAMVRVLTGISIWWFLVPGYAVGLFLMYRVPQMFTAIAFDSGGVSTGPMTATFMLPLAIGAAEYIPGANPFFDAFGSIAMVAMMPVIVIQLLALVYQYRAKHSEDVLQYLDEPEFEEDNSMELQADSEHIRDSASTLAGGERVDSAT